MNKVMVFGTFDRFHPGHKNFLKQAKKYGDYLIVIIARDKTVKKVKNKKPQHTENHRSELIKNTGLADEIILGNIGDKYAVIKKFKPDIICLGYDQNYFVDKLNQKLIEFNLKTKIIRLKSYKPHKFKTSIISHVKKFK